MKILTITMRYEAKRTYDYQSAGVGAEMTVSYDEGDKIGDVFQKGMNKLVPEVEAAADAAVKRLVDDDRAMKGL